VQLAFVLLENAVEPDGAAIARSHARVARIDMPSP
jgi:hypothetical protein